METQGQGGTAGAEAEDPPRKESGGGAGGGEGGLSVSQIRDELYLAMIRTGRMGE